MSRKEDGSSDTDTDIDSLDADTLLKRLGETTRKRKRVREDEPDNDSERYTSDGSNSGGDKAAPSDDDGNRVHSGNGYTPDEHSDKNAREGVESCLGDEGPRIQRHVAPPPPAFSESKRVKSQSVLSKREERTTFADLGASKALVASLGTMSIRHPTEVQTACIPPLLAGE